MKPSEYWLISIRQELNSNGCDPFYYTYAIDEHPCDHIVGGAIKKDAPTTILLFAIPISKMQFDAAKGNL